MSSTRLLKNSPIFFAINVIDVNDDVRRGELEQRNNVKNAIHEVLNIYQVTQTPTNQYLQIYEKHFKYLNTMVFETKRKNEDEILKNQFTEIFSQDYGELVEDAINKIGEVFSETQLLDEEKNEF